MAILLILLGSLSWITTMFKSGLRYSYGLGFWGANGHDGIWHLAVIEGLIKGNFSNPVYAGEYLKNYHLGFDLFVALINRLTTIPVLNLYFQILPIIFALAIGILTYKFVYLWKKSKSGALWSVFFVYFGGGWGWIVSLIREKNISSESIFWSQQAISTLINPPFALSLIFILLGLIFFIKYRETKKLSDLIFTSLFFGLLIQIKAYAGVLVLSGLLVLSLIEIIKDKKFEVFKILISSLALSLIIFLPFNRSAGSIFVFKPFWFLETMVGFADRLYFPRLYNAILSTKGIFSLKGVVSLILSFGLFVVGNFGTRIIGFGTLLNMFKRKDWKDIQIYIFLLVIGLAGIVIPQFFVQKGTPWNTIQFFYYSLFIFSIFSGVFIAENIKNMKLYLPVSIGIILLTIPTTIGSLKYFYLPMRPPAKLSNNELAALNFLSQKEQGVVLTYPYDINKAKEAESNPPRPLYLYESTAYVSAFSKHQVFLEDQVNLEITGIDWEKRREEVLDFYSNNIKLESDNFLLKNNIKFIYLLKSQDNNIDNNYSNLQRIYENDEVNIYEVIR